MEKIKNVDELLALGTPALTCAFENQRIGLIKRLTSSDENPYSRGNWEAVNFEFGEKTFWVYLECSNNDRNWTLTNAENYSSHTVENKTFSLTVWVMLLSIFSMEVYESPDFVKKEEMLEALSALYGNAINNAHNILTEDELNKFNRLID